MEDRSKEENWKAMKDIKETQKTIFAAIFSNSLNEEDKAEAGQLFLKTFGGTEYFKGCLLYTSDAADEQ